MGEFANCIGKIALVCRVSTTWIHTMPRIPTSAWEFGNRCSLGNKNWFHSRKHKFTNKYVNISKLMKHKQIQL